MSILICSLTDRSASDADLDAATGKDAVVRALRDELAEVRAAAATAAAAAHFRIAEAEAETQTSKSAAEAVAAAVDEELTELQRLLQEAEAKAEQLTILGKKMREDNERSRARWD